MGNIFSAIQDDYRDYVSLCEKLKIQPDIIRSSDFYNDMTKMENEMKTDLNFDFSMGFDCPHCGKHNDLEPKEYQGFDIIYLKFIDWIGNNHNGDKIDIKLECYHCDKQVHLNQIVR